MEDGKRTECGGCYRVNVEQPSCLIPGKVCLMPWGKARDEYGKLRTTHMKEMLRFPRK